MKTEPADQREAEKPGLTLVALIRYPSDINKLRTKLCTAALAPTIANRTVRIILDRSQHQGLSLDLRRKTPSPGRPNVVVTGAQIEKLLQAPPERTIPCIEIHCTGGNSQTPDCRLEKRPLVRQNLLYRYINANLTRVKLQSLIQRGDEDIKRELGKRPKFFPNPANFAWGRRFFGNSPHAAFR